MGAGIIIITWVPGGTLVLMRDPLAGMRVGEEGFAYLAGVLLRIAAGDCPAVPRVAEVYGRYWDLKGASQGTYQGCSSATRRRSASQARPPFLFGLVESKRTVSSLMKVKSVEKSPRRSSSFTPRTRRRGSSIA